MREVRKNGASKLECVCVLFSLFLFAHCPSSPSHFYSTPSRLKLSTHFGQEDHLLLSLVAVNGDFFLRVQNTLDP